MHEISMHRAVQPSNVLHFPPPLPQREAADLHAIPMHATLRTCLLQSMDIYRTPLPGEEMWNGDMPDMGLLWAEK